MLHQGDACDGTDHCSPHELQPNIQPLHGGAGSKLAPLVQLQESLVLLLKPGGGQEGSEAPPVALTSSVSLLELIHTPTSFTSGYGEAKVLFQRGSALSHYPFYLFLSSFPYVPFFSRVPLLPSPQHLILLALVGRGRLHTPVGGPCSPEHGEASQGVGQVGVEWRQGEAPQAPQLPGGGPIVALHVVVGDA